MKTFIFLFKLFVICSILYVLFFVDIVGNYVFGIILNILQFLNKLFWIFWEFISTLFMDFIRATGDYLNGFIADSHLSIFKPEVTPYSFTDILQFYWLVPTCLSIFVVLIFWKKSANKKKLQKIQQDKVEVDSVTPQPLANSTDSAELSDGNLSPVAKAVKLALTGGHVTYGNRTYFFTNTGECAYRVNSAQFVVDSDGVVHKQERSQQDKEDDTWHFVGFALLLSWIVSDGDIAEIAKMELFKAEFLADNNLDEMPESTNAIVAFNDVDTSAYDADVINTDVMDDYVDSAFDDSSTFEEDTDSYSGTFSENGRYVGDDVNDEQELFPDDFSDLDGDGEIL